MFRRSAHVRAAGLLTAAAGVVALSACASPAAPGNGGGAGPEVDGSIPANTSIALDDSDHPALSRLDAALVAAVRAAAVDARAAGIELRVTSGWRGEGYQRRLFDEAVAVHGSVEEARRWVTTPEKSAHVRGEAIDIGPTDAADWLVRNGADYGLCQAYANEMWHFELLTAPGGECPAPRVDATG
ncbi:M15 family metallopeptidase [Saccharothrix yanglingensis]|uniref:Peptidase M15B and M15C n=1 Tax=Saccharothrix yanglingensis TaxID=659496 RepID=A0ABU0WZB8_9PSEU|nr:M15 family metallopeptidase [Saccharothrix yanglingensis]MDQ2585220.1 peptidase M15B and M15C [Saccharothrix yanglingensis]